MADHRTEQIINKIQALLGVAAVAAGKSFRNRNFNSLRYPDDFTGASLGRRKAVITLQGPEELEILNFPNYEVSLTVFIDCIVQGFRSDTVDPTNDPVTVDALNELRKQVSIKMHEDRQLGLPAFVIDTTEISTDAPEVSEEGNEPLGTQRISFLIKYRRSQADPSA